ncbi:hypothetical protein ACWEJ6_47530 [Nonomuraea sp. NPDC004702]
MPTLPCWITVHGLGGIGKTSLVIEFSHCYLHEHQLAWHLPAEDPTALSAAFADLASHISGRQDDGADPVHQVHTETFTPAAMARMDSPRSRRVRIAARLSS